MPPQQTRKQKLREPGANNGFKARVNKREATPTEDANNRVNFLEVLPTELRELIWAKALEPLCKRALHPYDNHNRPSHNRFKAYTQLRLINKQVSEEVQKVFRLDIAPNIVFYCVSPQQLRSLRARIRSHQILQDARFQIRTPGMQATMPDDEEAEFDHDIEVLIENQPGFDLAWGEFPGFYKQSPERGWGDEAELPRWFEDEKEKEPLIKQGFVFRKNLPQGPCCGAEKQGRAMSGSKMKKGKKPGNSPDCKEYEEVVYPPLNNSLRVTTYAWDEQWPGYSELCQAGCTVLEGKIMDVEWDAYNREVAYLTDREPGRGGFSDYDDYADFGFAGYGASDWDDWDDYESQYGDGSDDGYAF